MSANQDQGLGICIWRKFPTRRVQPTGTMLLLKSLWVRTFILHLGTDRLLRPGGGGSKFLRDLIFRGGGQFWKCTKCGGGVDISRPRTGLLCKSYYCYYSYSAHCQTILWLKQIYVSFKSRQKIRFGGSLSATKWYPYKAWPRILSAIFTTRNVACLYAQTSMHTAEIWKKICRLRLSSLAILHIHKHKDIIDIDGIIT